MQPNFCQVPNRVRILYLYDNAHLIPISNRFLYRLEVRVRGRWGGGSEMEFVIKSKQEFTTH